MTAEGYGNIEFGASAVRPPGDLVVRRPSIGGPMR